ncbi:hypothetical protein [Actinomadura litoris]|uniref:Uncharacterized protein n=1 Tax=Actinomadura litoris TaxID=2678616 RepID=A0A7K1L9Q2_9ACTN|nr:hypothetical protein [Actinomadura litoris]MUN41053.1 hypothetical protein [Actinomadura litoris]
MAIKRAISYAVATVAAVAPLAITPSASADTPARTATAPAAACHFGANPPYLSGREVSASVWSTRGCPKSGSYTGNLQRKRWYGWQTLRHKKWWGAGGYSLTKGCKKGSTYTYRSYISRWPDGRHVYSAQRRLKCR